METGMAALYRREWFAPAALFVDFDNIYLGLQREDPTAAEQFATDPTRWLLWLQDNLPHEHEEDDRKRKVLFRRCYLNPSQFGRFRPRSGQRPWSEVADGKPAGAAVACSVG